MFLPQSEMGFEFLRSGKRSRSRTDEARGHSILGTMLGKLREGWARVRAKVQCSGNLILSVAAANP